MAELASNGDKLIGKIISGYVLVEVMGICRWGPVYSAVQTSMDRAVAMKVLTPRSDLEADQFLAAARTAAQITHPHIVAVFEAGFSGEYYFCATEFIDGPPLEKFLRKGAVVDEHCLLQTIAGLAEALETLWQRGIAHEPPTEEHIVTAREGLAKLSELEPVNNPASKLEKEDIAALGIVLGRVVNSIGPVSEPVGQLVKRMVGASGRQPFATLAELVAEATRLDQQLFSPLPQHDHYSPAAKLRRMPWWVIVLGMLVIVGLIAVTIYVLRRP
ncbi:MAG: protein kinase [Verrucomicrobiia bacterium]